MNQNLNRPITTNEIEAVIIIIIIKTFPQTVEFYQAFKEEQASILFKLFQKIEKERRLPISIYEISIALIPKLDQDIF